MNDIFFFIDKSILYNYADDDTLAFSNSKIDILKNTLENKSKILINWFNINKMQANPDKFQVIAVGKMTNEHLK